MDPTVKLAREAAERIQRIAQETVRGIHTIAPVIVENIRFDDETGLPTTADVRLKHEPEGTLIPACPILGATGFGGTFLPPIVEGMVATGLFSMVPLDDLLFDSVPNENKRRGRALARVDCMVLPFSFFPVNGVFSAVPSGYDSGDFLIQHPDVGVIWMDSTRSRIYLGDPATAKKVLVDGDSNSGGSVPASQDKVWVG